MKLNLNLNHMSKFPKEVWVFVSASFVNSLGNAFMWPLTTLYIFSFFHRSAADAGLVLLGQALASIMGQLVGGTLFHRIGMRTLVVWALAITSLFQFSLMFTSNFHIYAGLMACIGFFNAISMPAISAFIGFRWADRRREMYNIAYVGNNLGVAIGTACSGIIASFSYHLTFVMNGVTSILFATFFWIFMRKMDLNVSTEDMHKQKKTKSSFSQTWQLLGAYQLYLFMAMGALFIMFGNSIWGTGISTFLDSEGMKPISYSILWTMNGVLIFVGQPFVKWLNQTFMRQLTSQLTGSAIFYFAGFVMILINHSYPMIVLAMITITIGEMLISPTIPAFISERSGSHAPFYLGVEGAISSLGRLFGPYMIGLMYDAGGIQHAAWVAVGGGILAVVCCMIHASFHRDESASLHANHRM
ncbi:MFS transporter [Paenibacillus selenitireducens]|uniref:MFS transporter n=1 Tax=Paenibacillus selenitireducens TaxID=1324314 RepID=A0A1T2XKK6_9BACL|nr:MFS transporter [Paenibacillus selenitireducens]OPA80409.1 MFS transporter [Paenibacillus selenitireducens]